MLLHQNATRRSARRRTLLSALVGVVALVAASGASADQAYTDPAGDSGTAPDVTAVGAAHDSAGTISFTVTTNQPVLPLDASVDIYIDSDRNPATGLPVRGLGADHFFYHDGEFGGGLLLHVMGNLMVVDLSSTLTTSYGAGTLLARINRIDLDDTQSFRFLVETERDDDNDATVDDSDAAPNGPPFYEYTLARPLSLAVGKPSGASGGPVAGKAFMITAPVTRSDGQPFSSGTIACKAKAGPMALRAAGRVANGAARCSMRIPKTAKGKQLRGRLTVSTTGATAPVTRPFAFRIR
jgi:hypothetical protein